MISQKTGNDTIVNVFKGIRTFLPGTHLYIRIAVSAHIQTVLECKLICTFSFA